MGAAHRTRSGAPAFGLAAAGLAAVLVLCLAALLAASGAAVAQTESLGAQHLHTGRTRGLYQPLQSIPSTAEVVTVGAYWVNIYGVDFQDNTCFITAYVWCRWRGETDPTLTLEFANAVQDWQLKRTNAFAKPKIMPNGEKYQEMRVSGLFYQPYDLRDYPLDSQYIDLYLEDSSRTLSEAVYVADTKSSGLDASLAIPGWDVIGLSSQAYVHNYQTDFGDLTANPDATRFTSLLYTVEIERDVDYFIWKLMFPLVIVLLTNWLALLLRPNWIDLRTGMPATALLTLVFLQVTYSSGLPELSYLVLMDKIYVMAYAMVIATLLQVIWSNHEIKQHQLELDHEVRRLDLASAVTQFSVFWGVVIYLILMK
jgi:hypothetical protein